MQVNIINIIRPPELVYTKNTVLFKYIESSIIRDDDDDDLSLNNYNFVNHLVNIIRVSCIFGTVVNATQRYYSLQYTRALATRYLRPRFFRFLIHTNTYFMYIYLYNMKSGWFPS